MKIGFTWLVTAPDLTRVWTSLVLNVFTINCYVLVLPSWMALSRSELLATTSHLELDFTLRVIFPFWSTPYFTIFLSFLACLTNLTNSDLLLVNWKLRKTLSWVKFDLVALFLPVSNPAANTDLNKDLVWDTLIDLLDIENKAKHCHIISSKYMIWNKDIR